MVVWQGNLKVKPGMREAYLRALQEADLINIFRGHPGNVFYVIGPSLTDENTVEVADAWETKQDFVNHDASADVDIWREIYAQYVTDCRSNLYE